MQFHPTLCKATPIDGTNEIRFYSVDKTILFQKTNEELDSVDIWRKMSKAVLAIASFFKFHSPNFNEFFSSITFISRLWKLSEIPSRIKVIQNISKKLTLMADNSFKDASHKISIFKAVANFESAQSLNESWVEIMKVLIVLVLLVAFAGCEETTQELEKDYKCDICLDGAQFTRENIDMDLDVIYNWIWEHYWQFFMTSKISLHFQELNEKVKSEYCGSLNFFVRWACRNGVDRNGEYVYYQIKDGESNKEICEALKVC